MSPCNEQENGPQKYDRAKPDLETVMRNIFVNMIDEDDIIHEEKDESRE